MTMAEIERYCEAKAKRREAETARRNAELDKNQKMMDNALARLATYSGKSEIDNRPLDADGELI